MIGVVSSITVMSRRTDLLVILGSNDLDELPRTRGACAKPGASRTTSKGETREMPQNDPSETREGELSAAGESSVFRRELTGWLGLLFAGIPALVTTSQLVVVSHFDPHNISIIVSSLNIPTAFLNVLFQILPALLSMSLFVVLQLGSIGTLPARRAIPAGLIGLALAAILTPRSSFFLLTLAVAVNIAQIATSTGPENRVSKRGAHALTSPQDRKTRRYLTASLVAGLAITMIHEGGGSGIWLPHEIIYLKNGQHHLVHVLQNNDHDIIALGAHDENVFTVRQDDITGRRICTAKEPPMPAVNLLGIGKHSFVGPC
ncbi:hypothetical protein [Lentzea sp. NPDC051838]|uniref:hypothetical protein n=1 Tax=Lentzea sp. NPDC051838 TaxID=3154849 RepID=UPI0034488A8B